MSAVTRVETRCDYCQQEMDKVDCRAGIQLSAGDSGLKLSGWIGEKESKSKKSEPTKILRKSTNLLGETKQLDFCNTICFLKFFERVAKTLNDPPLSAL